MYQLEWDAAQEYGFRCSLIDFEALVQDDAARATRKVCAEESENAIYRGWMLSPERYSSLFNALRMKNIELINGPVAFKHCHYLPEWYPKLLDHTPKSIWVDHKVGDQVLSEQLSKALRTFERKPVIVKDFVKSEKHHWNEACFIPDAADSDHVMKVVNRFIELRDVDLEGGLVFREFVELQPLSMHSKSGMPLTQEFRLFVLDGKILYAAKYWDEGDYGDTVPALDQFESWASVVDSRFFTMDVALLKSGEWILVELGDAQVAGLPENSCARPFYEALRDAVGSKTAEKEVR